MPLQIDWPASLILITSPTTEVDAQTLHDFIENEMATPVGELYDDIIQPEGKIEDPTNPGVYSQIIMVFHSPWQVQFWGGSGYTRLYGGKMVGGLNDQVLKATGTAGDISVLESPVDGVTVVVSGTSGLTPEESQQLDEIHTGIQVVGVDVEFIKQIEGGRWVIDETAMQMIFYDSDNVTEVARFDLLDINGAPTGTPADAYERTRA